MPATETQIRDALIGAFTSVWTATPLAAVSLPNQRVEPAILVNGQSWMELQFSGGSSSSQTIGMDLLTGTRSLLVSAYTPLNDPSGDDLGRQLLDLAVGVYQGQAISAGTATLTVYSASAPRELPDSGYFKLAVMLNFKLI